MNIQQLVNEYLQNPTVPPLAFIAGKSDNSREWEQFCHHINMSKKTSGELFEVVISRVGTVYGSPMGRNNKGQPGGRVFDRQVLLTDGYDNGGAYWGTPNNLRVRYNKTLTFIEFYRSYSKIKI